MKFDKTNPIKIVHQGVDTLQTSHVIMHDESYVKYQKLLHFLEQKKQEAILANANYEFENGITFDFMSFGRFNMRPKGQGRYKYVILNQDITIYFSTVLLGANDFNTPQIKVDFSAKFLTLLGHEKAYQTVLDMFEHLLIFDDYMPSNIDDFYPPLLKTQMLRLDLCTDIQSIQYTPSDKYKFQTSFKNDGHIPFLEHMQFNRLTGFTFGKGDYMMRIYDKRLELNNNASKLWLTRLWVENGYSEIDRPSVWRHEVQMRRSYLKKFREESVHDEVRYFFDMLPNLWTFAYKKVNYVDLTKEQSLRIMDGYYSPDNLRQLFYRVKKKSTALHWGLCSTWKGEQHQPPKDLGQFDGLDASVPKRFFKSFISTVYKFSNGDPLSVLNFMDLVQDELTDNHGYTLHDYGENKLLSSYVKNAEYISNYGFTIDRDFTSLAKNLYAGMREKFLNLNDPLFGSSQRRLAHILNNSRDPKDKKFRQMIVDDINGEFNTEHEKQINDYCPILEVPHVDNEVLDMPYV